MVFHSPQASQRPAHLEVTLPQAVQEKEGDLAMAHFWRVGARASNGISKGERNVRCADRPVACETRVNAIKHKWIGQAHPVHKVCTGRAPAVRRLSY